MQKVIVCQCTEDADVAVQRCSYFKSFLRRAVRWQFPGYLAFLTIFATLMLGFVGEFNFLDPSELDLILNYPAICGISVFNVIMTICGGTIVYILLAMWVAVGNPGINAKWMIVLRHVPGIVMAVTLMLAVAGANRYISSQVVGSYMRPCEGARFSLDDWQWLIGRHGDKIKPLMASGLVSACRERDESLVDFLLAHGGDPNKLGEYGSASLHAVSWPYRPEGVDKARKIACSRRIFKKLIAHGADINGRDSCGQTPLHGIVAWGTPQQVAEYLAAGADVNITSEFCGTPLDVAFAEMERFSPTDRKSHCWHRSTLTEEQKDAEFDRAKAVVELLIKSWPVNAPFPKRMEENQVSRVPIIERPKGLPVSFFGITGRYREIVYVIDRSELQTKNFDALKMELIRSISELREPQEFNIIFHSTRGAMVMEPPGLKRATKENKIEAARFIKSVCAEGLPNTAPAVGAALHLLSTSAKFDKVVYLLIGTGDGDLQPVVDIVEQRNAINPSIINTLFYGDRPDASAEKIVRDLAEKNQGQYKWFRAE